MKKQEERFLKVLHEGSLVTGYRTILVDKRTGVNYLFVQDGDAGGLTVLVDANGKPVVTIVEEK